MWNLTSKLQIYFIYLGQKSNGVEIVQSFVVHNSNLMRKMFPRFSEHYSNQTLVLSYILKHVKGTQGITEGSSIIFRLQ